MPHNTLVVPSRGAAGRGASNGADPDYMIIRAWQDWGLGRITAEARDQLILDAETVEL